jgi:CheY-like chemotaxis protein
VDDEEIVRLVVRAVLGYRGYCIVDAPSGADALQKLAEQPGRFDLVLLDLNMPKMDGCETLRRLRQADPAVPVIVLSGDCGDEVTARITEAGRFDPAKAFRQPGAGPPSATDPGRQASSPIIPPTASGMNPLAHFARRS